MKRDVMLHELSWCHEVDLCVLTTPELLSVYRWYKRRMKVDRFCSAPVTGRVQKERRRGATNKMAWRFVVYVGPRIDEMKEVAVRPTRIAARAELRRQRAKAWARMVKR